MIIKLYLSRPWRRIGRVKSITPLILNFITRWGCVVNIPAALLSEKKPESHWIGGWWPWRISSVTNYRFNTDVLQILHRTKVKGKAVPSHAIVAYRGGSRTIAYVIRNLALDGGEELQGTHWKGGWIWTFRRRKNFCPTGNRTPNCPAHSLQTEGKGVKKTRRNNAVIQETKNLESKSENRTLLCII